MEKCEDKIFLELPVFAQLTIAYLEEHICDDLSLDDIAGIVNYSPYHFIRIFKVTTGKTPFEYFIDMKIEKAKELLINYDYSIIEVSLSCGFKDRTHFSNTFKKKTGISPSVYRKMNRY